jgi:signal transduction histidine kinase/ActR/RegA family two-component response regulator
MTKKSRSTKKNQPAIQLLQDKEHLFENVMAAMGDGLTIQDLDMRILYQNKFMKDTFGDARGELCYRIYEQRDELCVGCPIQAAYKDGMVHRALRIGITKKGEAFRFENIASPLRDQDGVIVAGMELVRIVEEREKAKEDLERTKKMLEQSLAIEVELREEISRQAEEDKAKLESELFQAQKLESLGMLAGGVAHDFNNQLTGIKGCADLLRLRFKEDSELYKLAEMIVQTTDRASNLTSQLLAFAREGKFQSIPIDLHMVIQEVVSILKHSIDKRIRIKQHLDAENSVIMGDPAQLQNTFLNLALNSRDAMPRGGELRFSTETVALDRKYCMSSQFDLKPAQYVQVCVSDNGMGMDAKTAKRIFEPFFTTKGKGKGTGMGLAAVYGTVRNHMGAIEVETRPGTGSTFKVLFPLSPRVEAVSGDHKQKIGTDVSLRILLVDDEKVVRDTTSGMLQAIGHQVIVCSNGMEAVTEYEAAWEEIDLVILDVIMPGMNGHETLMALKKINPDVKVLLSSGYSLEEEIKGAVGEGSSGFLKKPYNIEDLRQMILKIINGGTPRGQMPASR